MSSVQNRTSWELTAVHMQLLTTACFELNLERKKDKADLTAINIEQIKTIFSLYLI